MNCLLLVFVCSLGCLQFIASRTIKTKDVAIGALDLMLAINKANVPYTLQQAEIQAIKGLRIIPDFYVEGPINRFKSGFASHDANDVNLKLYLPESKTIDDYLEFAVKVDKADFSWAIEDPNGLNQRLAAYFGYTLKYCNYVLSKNCGQLTLTAPELLQFYHQHFSINNSVVAFDKNSQAKNPDLLGNELVRHVVLHASGEFFVFIPQHLTVEEFVAECASTVGSEGSVNDFAMEIVNALQMQQLPTTQKVLWARIFAEMSDYVINVGKGSRFVKDSINSDETAFIRSLNDASMLKLFQKLQLTFDGIVIETDSNDKMKLLLNYISTIYPTTFQDLLPNDKSLIAHERVFEAFLNYRNVFFIHYYNILTNKSAKFHAVTIDCFLFEQKLKNLLSATKASLLFFNFSITQMTVGGVFTNIGSSYKCSGFPYFEDEKLTNQELIQDYASFIATKVNGEQGRNEVLTQFLKMFSSQKYLDEYKTYLGVRPVKKSQQYKNVPRDSRAWIYLLSFGIPIVFLIIGGVSYHIYRKRAQAERKEGLH